MSKPHILLASVFVALVTISCVVPKTVLAEGDAWTVSFEEAKKMAAEQGKDILMEFTGSDWCPPCKALHSKVLSKEVFLTKVPENYILLKLDSPRDKSKQSKEEIAQYKKLSAEYQVRGVPSVFLADAKGRPYVKLVGYAGQDADTYVKNVLEKASIRQKRDEFLAKAEEASGVEKAKLLDEAINQIDSELAFEVYADTIKEIVALDADDTANLKSKYEDKLRAAEVKNRLASVQRGARGNPKAALKELDALIDELNPQGEALQAVYLAKGSILFVDGDKDAAKVALETAVKIDPDSPSGKQIEKIIKANFK